MSDQPLCHHCGAKMVEYSHSLNKGVAAVLWKLYEGDGPVEIGTLGLTNSQYSNAPKVRYWNLAVRVTNDQNEVKGGWWQITDIGRDFVEGRISLPKTAILLRNVVLRFDGAPVLFSQISDGYGYQSNFKEQARQQINYNFDDSGQGALL